MGSFYESSGSDSCASPDMSTFIRPLRKLTFDFQELEKIPLQNLLPSNSSNPNAFEDCSEFRCFSEKISLKGVIWGQIIIVKNFILFKSDGKERPVDPFFKYFFENSIHFSLD